MSIAIPSFFALPSVVGLTASKLVATDSNNALVSVALPTVSGSALISSDAGVLGWYDLSGKLNANAKAADSSLLDGHNAAYFAVAGSGMVYPGSGIAVSNGTGWGSSLTDNHSNWDAAYGWGNHANAGYVTGTPWTGLGYLTNIVCDSPLSGAGTSASHLTVDLSGRQVAHANLTSLAGLSFTSASFVKMTAAGTFALDTTAYVSGTPWTGMGYLTSLSGAVLTSQAAPQTIGATGTRLAMLWATDITLTNALAGSVTGNAGSVTNGVYTNAANSMSVINPLTTLAESWIGPSSTTGIYFKSGNVGINHTAPLTKLTVLDTIATSPRGILSMQISSGTDGARVGFAKARGTLAAPTTIVTGDVLGRMMFRGYDGANYLEMGSIECSSFGTIGTNRVPTFLQFSVATDAATSVLTDVMRVTPTGVMIGSASAPHSPLEITGLGGSTDLINLNKGTGSSGLKFTFDGTTYTSYWRSYEEINNGNLSFGVANSSSVTNEVLRLHSSGQIFFGLYTHTLNNVSAGVYLRSTTPTLLTLGLRSVYVDTDMIQINSTGIGFGVTPTSPLHYGKADSSAMTDFLMNPTVKTSGNFMDWQIGGVSKAKVDYVGIGTFGGLISPTIKVSTAASLNRVLTSNSNGDGTWKDRTSQVVFTVDGTCSLKTGTIRIYNQLGRDTIISRIFLSVGTAPTGADLTVDVKLNGTSLGYPVSITAGAYTAALDLYAINTPPDQYTIHWQDTSYLTFDVTQIGATIPGSDLTVHIRYV